MPEPTSCAGCCVRTGTYCDRCDLLVGLPGLHVIKVVGGAERLTVTVESPPAPVGCPECGVIATSRGRRTVVLVDAPCFGRPVRVVWRKRTWRCREPACPGRAFTEQDDRISRPRGLLTVRACWWVIGQLRAEHASVHGLARQLGTTWRTVWRSIAPLLQAMADDPSRFDGCHQPGRRRARLASRRRAQTRSAGPDRDGRSNPGPTRTGPGPAAQPGSRTIREGLRRLAERPRRRVPKTVVTVAMPDGHFSKRSKAAQTLQPQRR